LGTKVEVVDDSNYLSATVLADLPTNYDARPGTGCVHAIRDQASCGSCWAFAGSEVLSDRFCLAGVDVILSPEDLVACDRTNFGCNGGNLSTEFKYLEKTGIVTDSCFPYTSFDGSEPKCATSCADGSKFLKYKCAAGSTVTAGKKLASQKAEGAKEIQSEIFAHGPVETGFNVYADFMNYASGVYHHVAGALEGGHAVKILGWGHDETVNEDYWLCANSWDVTWGE